MHIFIAFNGQTLLTKETREQIHVASQGSPDSTAATGEEHQKNRRT